jgi:diacylglycerol kinase (ATP)
MDYRLPESFLLMENPSAGLKLNQAYVQTQIERVKAALTAHNIGYVFKRGVPDELIECYGREHQGLGVFGGDGTLNNAVNTIEKLQLEPKLIGLFSRGSGNDFLGALHLKPKVSLEESVDTFIDGLDAPERHIMNADYFRAELDGSVRYGVNFAGFGFVSDINRRTTKQLKRLLGGVWAYTAGFLKAWPVDYRRFEVASGGKQPEWAVAALVCNGMNAGGGMVPVPWARPDDGELDVFMLAPVPWILLPFIFPKVIPGKHTELKWCRFEKGSRIEFEFSRPVRAQIDGEMLDRLVSSARIDVAGGLTLIGPPKPI